LHPKLQLTKQDLRLNKPSRDEYLTQPKIPLILVLGNERKGVSEAALKLSHQHIHIPMFGMGNSLNVSTAGAIVLAECANQIRKSPQT
jgi:tRNA G18 (ribose-2'-O)-methylase SpoU